VKFRIATVAATAVALSFAVAGSAVAGSAKTGSVTGSAGHPAVHRTARLPQVNGSRLQTGLLPPSAFGNGFTTGATLNTGRKLQPTRATMHVPSMSCTVFEDRVFFGVFGDTAGALSMHVNPNAPSQFPDTIFYGYQAVDQFPTIRAAGTFFAQSRAKFAHCQTFSEPNPGDGVPGGGTFQGSSVSVKKTGVSGYQAFVVTQSIAMSESPGTSWYRNILFVTAGTDVYSLWETGGVNDEPSTALMSRLIRRIQALYPHRA
jgi:hypothetical protein